MKFDTQVQLKTHAPEEAILEILRAADTEVSLPKLLDRLRERGVGDHAVIKAAILKLTAKGEIEMTRHRNFRARKIAAGASAA